MGLISGILGLPLAPVRGVVAAAEQIQREAEDQFYDPARIRAQLQQVDRMREDGVLSEDEALQWEDELVERLLSARERQERKH